MDTIAMINTQEEKERYENQIEIPEFQSEMGNGEKSLLMGLTAYWRWQ